VVCNSSPLISLARIQQFEILRKIFTTLIIPNAVWQEVVEHGGDRPGAEEIIKAKWIKKEIVKNKDLVLSLKQNLGAGEAESIALAIEKRADLLIMDERLGRETARFFGVRHIGVIGVLVQAKRKGEIKSVKPYMDELRFRGFFRISDSLYHHVLEHQGEL